MRVPTLPGFCMDSLRYRFHRAKILGYYAANVLLPAILKEEDKMVNLEEMKEGIDFIDMYLDACNDSGSSNLILHERLIGVAQDMVDDGIL